jgi:interferon gamma-inducible protein 30
MTSELYKAYQSVLDIVNISLVPYGNAHEVYDPTNQTYKFTCQHGPNECAANLIHVKSKPKKRTMFRIIRISLF